MDQEDPDAANNPLPNSSLSPAAEQPSNSIDDLFNDLAGPITFPDPSTLPSPSKKVPTPSTSSVLSGLKFTKTPSTSTSTSTASTSEYLEGAEPPAEKDTLSMCWSSRVNTITLREVTMLGFMNAVTDKPEWTKKVFDEEIVKKWKAEAVTSSDVPPEEEMTERMFDYCIQELQHRAKKQGEQPNDAIQVFPGDVYKSDSAISEEVKAALQEAVRPLEDVQDHQKDWHPGSDGKVLDLVHPSLFPLIYGVSRILPIGARATTLDDCIERCGEGEVIPALQHRPSPQYSPKFQWLPCEVDISGDKARILTYINNLHPEHHRKLYGVIEDVITAAIPLWELTLVPLKNQYLDLPRRIQYDTCAYDPDPENDAPRPERREDESEADYWARMETFYDWCRNTRRVIRPDPPSQFEPIDDPESFGKEETFGKTRLQVIVKLANIELTPKKPKYEGGSWHVEGMMNESICATAIYYYSSDNITPSRLAFRQQSRNFEYDDVSYEQDHHDFLQDVYGLEQSGNTIQNLGSVDTREGRLITFPNVYQHQVQPFELADPTKPGYRKILALFLVDPNVDIISTADVPPQRLDWWSEKVLSQSPAGVVDGKDHLNKLPTELKAKVLSDVDDFPISMEQARVYREQLMEERKSFVLAHQQDFASVEISLCEH
ncbi:hypothetical protein NMY22_g18557 [Coprinellus aureogranulatus]|nr:hypothetical protein NMY22_g18557 [Coprinellus aureogranulatus]